MFDERFLVRYLLLINILLYTRYHPIPMSLSWQCYSIMLVRGLARLDCLSNENNDGHRRTIIAFLKSTCDKKFACL